MTIERKPRAALHRYRYSHSRPIHSARVRASYPVSQVYSLGIGDTPLMSQISLRSGLLLAACILIPLIIGAIGSLITYPNIAGWFAGLSKPWFSPPNWVFGPVWTILYILMGISLWLVIRNGWEGADVRKGMVLFGLQLVANFLWSVLFFGLQSPLGGLIDILVLLGLIISTILVFRRISLPASYLLIPYLCWVCFATAVNAGVVILN